MPTVQGASVFPLIDASTESNSPGTLALDQLVAVLAGRVRTLSYHTRFVADSRKPATDPCPTRVKDSVLS